MPATRLAEAGLHDRAQAFGGDFRADPLPEGADVISLVRVVHDHDDDAALAILSRRLAGAAAGRHAAAGRTDGRNAGRRRVEAYFAFYLLAMGSGRPRRAEELTVLLHTAGFTNVRLLPTRRPMLVRVLVASK